MDRHIRLHTFTFLLGLYGLGYAIEVHELLPYSQAKPIARIIRIMVESW